MAAAEIEIPDWAKLFDHLDEGSEENRSQLKVLIRRRQFQLAMDGDPVMLVWLGVQYLGQKLECTCGNGDDPLAGLLGMFDQRNREYQEQDGAQGGS